jgi:hypothetical protein
MSSVTGWRRAGSQAIIRFLTRVSSVTSDRVKNDSPPDFTGWNSPPERVSVALNDCLVRLTGEKRSLS